MTLSNQASRYIRKCSENAIFDTCYNLYIEAFYSTVALHCANDNSEAFVSFRAKLIFCYIYIYIYIANTVQVRFKPYVRTVRI